MPPSPHPPASAAIPAADGAARRIGLILHDFPAGGTERIAIRLANRWAAGGRDVTIFCGAAEGPARAEVDPAVRIVAAAPAIARGRHSRLRLGRALRTMIAHHPVDALVAPGNYHLPVLNAAGRLPCAVVCKLSNPLVRDDRGTLGQWLFDTTTRLSTRHVDRLIAMSPLLAREAAARLGTPVETIAEPIGEAPRRARSAAARGPRIVCAGRMVPQKDFALALRAFAALGRAGTELVLLGDGVERPALEALAHALGIGAATRFVGRVPDIAPWLADADALLLSSAYEGYPAVLVEAIAAGVPVVTTPCSAAIAEILCHRSFGQIAAADPQALADGLARVLADGGVDEGARRALVERHCPQAAADRWLATLDRLVARGD